MVGDHTGDFALNQDANKCTCNAGEYHHLGALTAPQVTIVCR